MGGVKKNKARQQRLYFIIFSLICVAIAVTAILVAFQKNIVFFRTPTDLVGKEFKSDERIRLGGMVKEGTLKQEADGTYSFVVTDTKTDLGVKYKGILPTLFREKQGVVAYGKMGEDMFIASEILAKHDENYMPRDVSNAIKKYEAGR